MQSRTSTPPLCQLGVEVDNGQHPRLLSVAIELTNSYGELCLVRRYFRVEYGGLIDRSERTDKPMRPDR